MPRDKTASLFKPMQFKFSLHFASLWSDKILHNLSVLKIAPEKCWCFSRISFPGQHHLVDTKTKNKITGTSFVKMNAQISCRLFWTSSPFSISLYRLHANWRFRGSSETPGCSSRGLTGLWSYPPPRRPSTSWQADHDPSASSTDSRPCRPALLRHQAGWPRAHAQTVPRTPGGQSLTRAQTRH